MNFYRPQSSNTSTYNYSKSILQVPARDFQGREFPTLPTSERIASEAEYLENVRLI